MAVEYRRDRGCWIWRFSLHKKKHKGYGYESKEKAREAEKAYRQALPQMPPTIPTSLVAASRSLLIAASRRSASRYSGLKGNLEKFILPWFGPTTDVNSILSSQVEEFIDHHLKRVQPMTVWHYVKDLNTLLNWCLKQRIQGVPILRENPTKGADLSRLKNRFTPKLPMVLSDFDKAAAVLEGNDRLYFDLVRFCGLRRDEGNGVQVRDVLAREDGVWLFVRGTKTAGSKRVIPVPPVLWERLLRRIDGAAPEEYVCSSERPRWKGRRVYDRRRLFARIRRLSGVMLRPKDLRDYFASIIPDSTVAQQMLGHTSLRTTAIYTRQVHERMVAGVAHVGRSIGATSGATQDVDGGQTGAKDAAPPTNDTSQVVDSVDRGVAQPGSAHAWGEKGHKNEPENY